MFNTISISATNYFTPSPKNKKYKTNSCLRNIIL